MATGPTSKHYAPQDVANGRRLVRRPPGGGVLVDPGVTASCSFLLEA
jgi:hypothetical protein